jgi:hypothetical protein
MAAAVLGTCAFAQFGRVVLGDGDDACRAARDFGLGAFDLDDQQRLDVRISGLGEGLRGADAGPVHELDGNRKHAGLDDVGHAFAGDLGRIEADQHGPRAFRLWQDAQGRLGDDAQLAFGAADHAEQVIARPHPGTHRQCRRCRPRMVTIFTPIRLLVVTPYFRQCAPPEFIAMLPAMAHASWLDGSGA